MSIHSKAFCLFYSNRKGTIQDVSVLNFTLFCTMEVAIEGPFFVLHVNFFFCINENKMIVDTRYLQVFVF